MELEKRNQRLENKVNKLKRKKRELKQEVTKLRAKIQSQESEEVDEMTGQDDDQGVSKGTHCYPYFFSSSIPITYPCHSITSSRRGYVVKVMDFEPSRPKTNINLPDLPT